MPGRVFTEAGSLSLDHCLAVEDLSTHRCSREEDLLLGQSRSLWVKAAGRHETEDLHLMVGYSPLDYPRL